MKLFYLGPSCLKTEMAAPTLTLPILAIAIKFYRMYEFRPNFNLLCNKMLLILANYMQAYNVLLLICPGWGLNSFL